MVNRIKIPDSRLVVDRDSYVVLLSGREEIHLPRKEFEIIWLLSDIPGKVYSREIIFESVWGKKSKSRLKTVDVHISWLRDKLGDQIIRTVHGVGYKITPKEIERKGSGSKK